MPSMSAQDCLRTEIMGNDYRGLAVFIPLVHVVW